MKILSVAEKPSVAKSISRILCTNPRTMRGKHKYCPNIFLDNMIFTSVLGHLYSHDFSDKGGWHESDPALLFDAPIERSLSAEMAQVAENIRALARQCDQIVIWTDCDREGENIAMQIKGLVTNIPARRARFSGISRQEITNALNSLCDINVHEAAAVDARIELDLRIGSAFTRFQTLAFAETGRKSQVLSFGPCQIPTLNFVVQRHLDITEFKSEKFYDLENTVIKDGIKNTFKWVRGPLFDKNCVLYFHAGLKSSPAIITEKTVQPREKLRPLPLRTVEFQRVCASYFKMSGHRIMEIAEKLYNNGYISYPRTETDAFPDNFDFKSIIGKLKRDEKLGEYASRFAFCRPHAGRNNDQAHSPIYPLKAGDGLAREEWRVYEFVARRFLGCISHNAKGIETKYTMDISYTNSTQKGRAPLPEKFTCRGLQVTELNYLEVYFYEKWETVPISDFQENQQLPNNIGVVNGATTAPEYLTESDLIALMDKNGIGTDATIHEHIQKIQARQYARKVGQRFIPTGLGIGLIASYKELGLDINEPDIRKNLETSLKMISDGHTDQRQVVDSEIALYKQIYAKLRNGKDVLKRFLQDGSAEDAEPGNGAEPGHGAKPGYGAGSGKGVPKTALGTKKGTKNPSGNARPKTALHEEANKENMPVPAMAVQCNCRKEAKKYVAKKSTNSGREFYSCYSLPKRCDFFAWADAAASVKPPQRKQTAEMPTNLKCDCGYDPARKTAHTEQNNGREFFCCNKNYKKCKFFKWADET